MTKKKKVKLFTFDVYKSILDSATSSFDIIKKMLIFLDYKNKIDIILFFKSSCVVVLTNNPSF